MNGQMLSCEERKKKIDEYIARNDPYRPLTPLKFDLRGYAAYIKEHQLKAQDITEDILRLFILA